MTDGRKYQPAHRAPRTPLIARPRLRHVAVPAVATLALGGLGVAGGAPAHAEDLDARVDRVQADVDRLDAAAQQRVEEQQRAQERVGDSKRRITQLDQRIAAQQRLADSLRLQLAQGVLTEEAAGGGASTGAAAEQLPDASEELLASVALVTEDTDGAANRLTEAEAAVEQLAVTRGEVRERLRERRTASQAAGTVAQQAQAALDQRQQRLDSLEDQQAEQQAEELASRSAVAYAMAQVGKSYVWGAAGPSSFDCSGLTMAAYATEGISLPHSSSGQYSSGTPVSESELQPGDLVFYYSPISHVGIYVGDGQIVNALNPGSGVQISGVHDMPYSGAVRPG